MWSQDVKRRNRNYRKWNGGKHTKCQRVSAPGTKKKNKPEDEKDRNYQHIESKRWKTERPPE